MTREELIEVFDMAKESKLDAYVALEIPGLKDFEYIIIKHKNLDAKIKYYCETYTENLEHNVNNDIKIIFAGMIDFYMGE